MCEVIFMLFGRKVCVSLRKMSQMTNFYVGDISFYNADYFRHP